MPLPWKKAKVSRISRFVSDLQSPNRGNSLVVETGFPTSLIDLFVKNRERLKSKALNKKKKKRQKQRNEKVVEEELVISDPVPLSNSRDLEELVSGSVLVENRTGIEECVVVVDDDGGVNGDKSVLLAVLKMFLVVVLTLFAKRLVVGITMSAFVLILVDYVGKDVCSLLNSFQVVLEPLIQRLGRGRKKCEVSRKGLIIQEMEEGEDAFRGGSCDLIERLSNCSEEIQVVGSSSPCMVEENSRREINLDFLGNVAEVDEDRGAELISEGAGGRRAKIKAKIKKLVPKKLRRGKKGKKGEEREQELCSEVYSCCEEDKLGRVEELKEVENGGRQELEDEGPVLLSQSLEEEEGKEKKMEMERKGSSGYPILFLIILSGLLGGRILALALTVAFCLMLDLVQRRGISVNDTTKRVPASTSR